LEDKAVKWRIYTGEGGSDSQNARNLSRCWTGSLQGNWTKRQKYCAGGYSRKLRLGLSLEEYGAIEGRGHTPRQQGQAVGKIPGASAEGYIARTAHDRSVKK